MAEYVWQDLGEEMKPDRVVKGKTFTFTMDGGTDFINDGFSDQLFGDTGFGGYNYALDLKQFPGDSPAFSRGLTMASSKIEVTLTELETALLAVGLWFAIVTFTKSDQTIERTKRLQVSKSWV